MEKNWGGSFPTGWVWAQGLLPRGPSLPGGDGGSDKSRTAGEHAELEVWLDMCGGWTHAQRAYCCGRDAEAELFATGVALCKYRSAVIGGAGDVH